MLHSIALQPKKFVAHNITVNKILKIYHLPGLRLWIDSCAYSLVVQRVRGVEWAERWIESAEW